jgi:hypothetical protein
MGLPSPIDGRVLSNRDGTKSSLTRQEEDEGNKHVISGTAASNMPVKQPNGGHKFLLLRQRDFQGPDRAAQFLLLDETNSDN